MAATSGRRAPVPRDRGSYEIRVKGRLRGPIDRIQALGLELVEVRRLPDRPGAEITRPG
jgi:hypothetical protein